MEQLHCDASVSLPVVTHVAGQHMLELEGDLSRGALRGDLAVHALLDQLRGAPTVEYHCDWSGSLDDVEHDALPYGYEWTCPTCGTEHLVDKREALT